MSTREPVDVAVIGAGIIGLAIGFEATKRGKRVVLLERDRVGSGAVHAAAGMLAPAAEAESEDRALVELALESCRMYPEFVAGVEAQSGQSTGYRDEGTLLTALNRDHLEELQRLAAIQQRLGLPVKWLTSGEVADREPGLSPRVVGGLLATQDRQVDPRRLISALAAAIAHAGGRVVESVERLSVQCDANQIRALTCMTPAGEMRLDPDTVVAAAGAWTNLLPSPPLERLPLRPVKGQILRLRGSALLNHVIRTPDVYLVPRRDGELVVGATGEEVGFDSTPTAGAVLDLLREAWRVVPGIYDLAMAEHSVGFRPALRDNLPVIGQTCVEGLYVATGHYRHGVMLAPATAELLLDWMETGVTPDLLQPFGPDRLASDPTDATNGGGL